MITLLLLFHPLLTTAYNLEVQNVIIYEAPYLSNQRTQSSGSFFGYSVLLSSQKHISPNGLSVYKSWIFVGAPKANYTTVPDHRNNKIPNEPGVTYRCPLPHKCVPMNVTNPDDEVTFIDQVGQHTLIEKGHGWFGAAMSLHEPTNSLTVCAPRTILRLYRSPGISVETMHGVCYQGALNSDYLNIDDKNFSTYNFSSPFWYSPLNGFSVHYPTLQASPLIQPIIGSPKHELHGTVHKMGQHKIIELPIGDTLDQFGYALTSGYYFNEEQLMMAVGAPGWEYVGQVAILESGPESLSIVFTIKGKEFGEYFGASLATGDINNDGLDDLIVGAPHWNNDNGRVYIFLGNTDGFLEGHILLLEGNVDDALYGYALTCGDLDGDGFDDIIVGAPWEDSGVIYVYNGAAKLAELHLLKPSQRIAASAIRKNILRFGFSLSQSVDIDGNGMSDIAVGAYASEHVVVLRSKPAVKTSMTLSTDPKILLRNSTSFVLKACLAYSYEEIKGSMWDAKINLILDKDYNRVQSASAETLYFVHERSGTCKFTHIILQKNITNRVDAIKIDGYHKFFYISSADVCAQNITQYMGSLCPTEYNTRTVTTEMEIPFDIGCGMDDVCHSSIFTNQYFQNTRDSTWIIGSDYLKLVLEIGNRGEAAYMTTVTFDMPRGVYLKSLWPTCQEEEDTGTFRVICNVGNPLETTMKSISLDLDMKNINNGSADGTTLHFSLHIKTSSVNSGVSAVTIPLHLKANVSVSLSGMAYDKSYFFENNERPKNFTFQHTYRISRFGVTPISEAFLIIEIPYKFDDLEFLSIVDEPRVSVSGRFYECQVIGVSVIKPRLVVESFFKAKYINSHTILINSTQLEDDRNTQSQFYNMLNSENIDITYLNCSVTNVICGQVVCKIRSLNTAQDVGKIELQLAVNDLRLGGKDGIDKKEKVFHITTDASVKVVDPKMRFDVSGNGIIVPVTTTLLYSSNHRLPKIPAISIWTILGSVLVGFLALCLLVVVLWKVGFFKRSKKQELESLKKCEDIPLVFDSDRDQHNVFL